MWVVTLFELNIFHSCRISIHTTRVGGDSGNVIMVNKVMISIHTTRVGGDFFLSHTSDLIKYFNPHHPCGWWLYHLFQGITKATISIHTTRVGGDSIHTHCTCLFFKFQSTPPVWVVTSTGDKYLDSYHISIHTTRVGGDRYGCDTERPIFYFNPHHPCGWWPAKPTILSPHF